MARYGRLDLLCLDELGYVHLDPRGAELLFQVITEREERASIAVATNLPFGEWGSVFPDGRLAAAVVDRLTYRAHVLETGTESYRLRASQQARKGGAKQGLTTPIRIVMRRVGGGARSDDHGGAAIRRPKQRT